jgi:nucleotide-binding universal stress UspA family protein
MNDRARVVVGVDGSTCARTALEFGLKEAAWRDAMLDVVSVAGTPEYWLVGIGMASSGATVPAREQVVRVRTVSGPPAATLIEQARGADLLVVGHRGRGGFASATLGSVSLHCVLHATCPVTIVRSTPQSADGNG